MKNRPLTIADIKQALWDDRFRTLFPNLKEEISLFLKDPGCKCNANLYRKIMSQKDKLEKYFPTKEVVGQSLEQEIIKKVQQNQWTVINCHIDQLEERLKQLPHSKKMVSLARWQDQVTVVIDELVAF